MIDLYRYIGMKGYKRKFQIIYKKNHRYNRWFFLIILIFDLMRKHFSKKSVSKSS